MITAESEHRTVTINFSCVIQMIRNLFSQHYPHYADARLLETLSRDFLVQPRWRTVQYLPGQALTEARIIAKPAGEK